jgi:hypothetical protein
MCGGKHSDELLAELVSTTEGKTDRAKPIVSAGEPTDGKDMNEYCLNTLTVRWVP